MKTDYISIIKNTQFYRCSIWCTGLIKKFPILTIIFLSLLVGIIAMFFLPQYPVTGDAAQYDAIAVNLIEKSEYIIFDTHLRAPGYPFFLAIIYKLLGHNYTTIYCLQFLILGLIEPLDKPELIEGHKNLLTAIGNL